MDRAILFKEYESGSISIDIQEHGVYVAGMASNNIDVFKAYYLPTLKAFAYSRVEIDNYTDEFKQLIRENIK